MDVRNSRGKFYEIKEEFAIIPAPIDLQSSLNTGGSRRTRHLPRNLLNSLQESIKSLVQNKRKTPVLKGIFTPKFRPLDAIVGVD